MRKSALPDFPLFAASALDAAPGWEGAASDMMEAFDRYSLCLEMINIIDSWRTHMLLTEPNVAWLDRHLECGGDPHWEDDRPYRGSEALKAWGERLLNQITVVNNASEAWRQGSRTTLNEALAIMGRSLGDAADPSTPLYEQVVSAYAEGSRLRQEMLDGQPLKMQPVYDRQDKAPFRDSLAAALGATPFALQQTMAVGYAALEALILDRHGLPQCAPMPKEQALQQLAELGICDSARIEEHIHRVAPAVLSSRGLPTEDIPPSAAIL